MSITLVEGEQRQLNVALTPIPPEAARLFGYVTDGITGNPIAGASVELYQNTVLYYSALTDISGYYDIPDIIPGSYDGVVRASGYEEYPF